MTRKTTLSALLAITGIALFASFAHAQFPHTVSYQGLIKQGQTPVVGPVSITVNYYNASTNVLLYSETFTNVQLNEGVFAIELGSQNGQIGQLFDAATPIEIGLRINGGFEMQRTRLTGAPYALTAYSLLGVPASLTPLNNHFFPLPVDGEGHIGTAVLPTATVNGQSIYDNNLQIVAGRNLTVNAANGRITIDGPATPTIANITGAAGITATQTNGTVTLATNADPAQFGYVNNALRIRTDIPVTGTVGTFENITVHHDGFFGGGVNAGGVETGALLTRDNATVQGALYLGQDIYAENDLLSVHSPAMRFDRTDVNGIGTLQTFGTTALASTGGNVGIGTTDPTNLLDMRTDMEGPAVANLENLSGNATVRLATPHGATASFLMTDGDNHTATIQTDGYNGMEFRMDVPYESDAFMPMVQNPLMTLGWDNSILFSARTLNFNGNPLQNIGMPLQGNDAATKDYVDNGAALSGDVIGSVTGNMLNSSNEGFGNRIVEGINGGNSQIFGLHVLPYFDNMPLVAGRAMMRTLHLYDGYAYRDYSLDNDMQTESADGRPGAALVIHRGSLEAQAPQAQMGGDPGTMSDRFADIVHASGTSVTIQNSLVRSNSVIMLTLEVPGGNLLGLRNMMITDKQDGQFTVRTTLPFASGAMIHYMIVGQGTPNVVTVQ